MIACQNEWKMAMRTYERDSEIATHDVFPETWNARTVQQLHNIRACTRTLITISTICLSIDMRKKETLVPF